MEHTKTGRKKRIIISGLCCCMGLAVVFAAVGVLRDSYFAGMLYTLDDLGKVNPVCAVNEGTVANCYFDSDVYQWGNYGYNEFYGQIDEPDNAEIIGLRNTFLKQVGFSEQSMKNTKFHVKRVGSCGNSFNNYCLTTTNESCSELDFPRLYCFEGAGTEDNPLLIRTPAQLIYLPYSFEYYSASHFYFQLANCIDMDEVAKNAYQPQTRCKTTSVSISTYYADGRRGMRMNTYDSTYSYSSTYPFQGARFAGTAEHDDECPFKHISLGTNSQGEPLHESHIIHHLTMSQPVYKYGINASTGEYYSYGWSHGWTWHGYNNNSYYLSMFSTALGGDFRDIQFVGGCVDPGDNDTLFKNSELNRPYTSNTPGTCLYESILIGSCGYRINSDEASFYQDRNPSIYNIHTSATIRVGQGDRTGVAVGGLVARGDINEMKNCSNSADFYGGYKTISKSPNIDNEIYYYGGLVALGNIEEASDLVNYGNISAVCLLGDGTKQMSSYTYSHYYAVSGAGIKSGGRFYNEGCLFDGPVVFDENDHLVFQEASEEDMIPVPLKAPIPEGKALLLDSNGGTNRHIITLSGGVLSGDKVFNKGNIYVLYGGNGKVYGLIGYSTSSWSRYTQRIKNGYNKGIFYIFSGIQYACGVGEYGTMEQCLNEGNFYYCRAAPSYYETNLYGLGPSINKGYSSGQIYFAPSSGTVVDNNNSIIFKISGCGEKNCNNCTFIGSITADYAKYACVPIQNHSVSICGTGLGMHQKNYGLLRFFANKQDDSHKISLSMGGCGCGYYSYSTVQYSENYADLFVDASNEGQSLAKVELYGVGIGRGSYSERQNNDGTVTVNDTVPHDNINFGDFAFSGKAESLCIYEVSGNHEGSYLYNEVNLGNVTILPGSVIQKHLYITGDVVSPSTTCEYDLFSDMMYGWRAGCELPEGLCTQPYTDLFSRLDPEKVYGTIDVSGDIGCVNIQGMSYYEYREGINSGKEYYNGRRVINHQDIRLHDALIRNYSDSYYNYYAKMMICALSYGKLSYSANYGNIEINNVVFQRDSVPVAAGAGGDHNINYGAVTVSDCVAGRRESSSYTPTLYLSGLSYSTPGEYLENRGRITADNTSYAVYNGTEYTNKGICISAGGITVFGKVVGCLNRGDILLNKVGYSSNVGGIRSYNNDSSSTSDNSTEKCVNYGNITLNECGIGMNVGGISGYDCKIKSCYNFGSICVSDPTTYPVDLPITNTLYAENCPARTMATDFGYYAQQTAVSSMAELYRTGMQTVYCYENSGTREYQVFNDYMTSVETNPAMNSDYPPADEDKVEKKDGEVIANDHVLYTDIYCYFSIDDLNSASARQTPDGEEINPGKNIYLKLNPDKTLWSAKNSSLLVSTDTADYDVETAVGQDVDFSGVRLKSYTLEEALSDASKWTENTEQWSIAVPYDPDNPDATLKKTYTKVYGVLTAEDGVHRSIVRVNVVIDSFRQSAVLEAVKLRTVYNTSWYNEETNQYEYKKSELTSTAETSLQSDIFRRTNKEDKVWDMEALKPEYTDANDREQRGAGINNGMKIVRNQPSLTDRDNEGHAKNDVIYYYMSDDIDLQDGTTKADYTEWGYENEFSNSQYSYSSDVTLLLSTANMTNLEGEAPNIWADISYQERLPSAENADYNDWEHISWNNELDLSDCDSASAGGGRYLKKLSAESLSNKEDPVTKHTNGYVKLLISNGSRPESEYYGGMYYGGLYRIDLYCERTKDAGEDTKKHFATLFLWKRHAKENDTYYYYGSNQNDWIRGEWYGTYSNYTDNSERKGYAAVNYNMNSQSAVFYRNAFYNNTTNEYEDRFNIPFVAREVGRGYSQKAYSSNREPVYDDEKQLIGGRGAVYKVNTDGSADKVQTHELTTSLNRIDVVRDDETGAFYPASYHWQGYIMSEDTQNIRNCDFEFAMLGNYGTEYVDNTGERSWRTYSARTFWPEISLYESSKNSIKAEENINIGIVGKDEARNPQFSTRWNNNGFENLNISVRPDNYPEEWARKDGITTDNTKVYFKEAGAQTYIDISENKNEYFDTFSVSSGYYNYSEAYGSFQLKGSAPAGSYKIVPMHYYHIDYSKCSDGDIKLYNYSDDLSVEAAFETRANNAEYRWCVPVTPYYIERQAHSEAYLMEFDADNDTNTPVIEEDETNTVPPSLDRSVYIDADSAGQEIHYDGYDNLMSGENRIDRYVITAFVPKDASESNLRMKTSFMARLEKWTGTGSPIDSGGHITDEGWEPLVQDDALTADPNYRQYQVHVSYNEYENGQYSGRPSVTYYRVVAEDAVTTTLYTVHVVPGYRNKDIISFEIAQDKTELDETLLSALGDRFDESAVIYQELAARYGTVCGTIKELNGRKVEYSETKWFDGTYGTDTYPSVYKLKPHLCDISLKVPEGYLYDVYMLNEAKDSYQLLRSSVGGFSGKRLVMNSSDEQHLVIRFVLKRDTQRKWGVNYIWNTAISALCEQNGRHYVQTEGGGLFNNIIVNG